MNRFGFTESVFELLICIALLAAGLFASTLGPRSPEPTMPDIPPAYEYNPDAESFMSAQSLLSQALDNPGVLQTQYNVSWSRDDSIDSSSVTDGMNKLDWSHVCIIASDFSNKPNWVESIGNRIEYTGLPPIQTTLLAFCARCNAHSGRSTQDSILDGAKFHSVLGTKKCPSPPFFVGDDPQCCMIAVVQN